MEMKGEYRIPASREAVWAALNNAKVLAATIPGAESVEKTSDTSFAAVAKTKVGPVSARFKGNVTLSNIDRPNGYTLTGEGNGGAAGFAKGAADIKLVDDNGMTILTYNVNAQIGGKLAQIGQRFIDSTASKLADEFFGNFSRTLGGEKIGSVEQMEKESDAFGKSPDYDAMAPTGVPRLPDDDFGQGYSPWIWGTALIAGVIVLILLFGR